MRIRCDRSDIVEKLGVIAGIVPTLSPKPILFSFLFHTQRGCLFVEANDLEVAGRVQIERVDVLDEGTLALPAAKVLSILREIPDQASGVTVERAPEGHHAFLRAEGYDFKLLGNDPEEFPKMSGIQAHHSVEVPRKEFAHSLRRVAIATSRDATRYQLQGVFFEVKAAKLTLTATDGKRLTNDVLKIEDPREQTIDAIVPNRATDAILKMLPTAGEGTEDRVTLGFTDTDIMVQAGSAQLNAKLIEGAYPNYRNALPQAANIHVRLKRADLLAAARGAQLMTDDQTSTVIFRFEKDFLTISSQAKDVGETRIQIHAEVENGPLEIRFNPSYFIDALRCIDDEEVRVELQSTDRPGVLRGGAHYRHMVMPLVLDKS